MTLEQNIDSSVAQDLAGKAILFEIGAKAGILEFIEHEDKVTVSDLSKKLNINEDFLETYLDVLKNLALLSKSEINGLGQIAYSKTLHYQKERNKVGYILWGMTSCAPLIDNTKELTSNLHNAMQLFHRQGEHVARTSRWMGEKDFYPQAEEIIINLKPNKVVDLGSGTCGLLIRLAKKIKDLKGIGIDISKDACDEAKVNLKQLELHNQIDVLVSPIQDLIQNKYVFLDADVVHAGFVFHDLLPDEEETLDELLFCINKTSPTVTLVIVDAIPFAQKQSEQAFSSAFTFLHKFYMGRKLLPESDWQNKLKKSGFNNISIQPLGISGGRIFVAKKDFGS